MNGLREVLDESSDCETDTPEQSESADSPPEVAARGFNFVLCGPDSFMMAPNALEHPPKPTVQLLHGLYFQGVDPLLKILHEPTMADLMLKGGPYLGQKPDDPAIEALSFAVYYAAVNTQDEESCKQVFGEDKMALLNRYRFAMEVFLARADFVNSMKIEVTQAFLIFLVGPLPCLSQRSGSGNMKSSRPLTDLMFHRHPFAGMTAVAGHGLCLPW